MQDTQTDSTTNAIPNTAPLTAADILAIDDRAPVPHVVAEWQNRTVYLRPLSGTDRDVWDRRMVESEKSGWQADTRAWLLSRSLCDPDGVLLFDTPEGVQQLADKSGAVLTRLFRAALSISGLDPEAAQELEGN